MIDVKQEETLTKLVESMKPSTEYVPEQERNFDNKTMPANTSPYVCRGTVEIDGKTYTRWSWVGNI